MTTLYRCSEGHISSVTRFPSGNGVRRCFFCTATAQKIPTDKVEAGLTLAIIDLDTAKGLASDETSRDRDEALLVTRTRDNVAGVRQLLRDTLGYDPNKEK